MNSNNTNNQWDVYSDLVSQPTLVFLAHRKLSENIHTPKIFFDSVKKKC